MRLTTVGPDFDPVRLELGPHQSPQFGVDGGQDLRELLDLGHRQATDRQGLGHLQTDVAAPTITARAGAVSSSVRMTAKVSPMECRRWTPSSGPRGPGPSRPSIGGRKGGRRCRPPAGRTPGSSDPGGSTTSSLWPPDVDPWRPGVEPELHPGCLEVGHRSVGQVLPVGHLTGYVVGDAADREVRVASATTTVTSARVELSGSQGGADPGVTAADGHEVHRGSFRLGVAEAGRLAVFCGGSRAVPAREVGKDDVGGFGRGDAGVQHLHRPKAKRPPTTWAAMNTGPKTERCRQRCWRTSARR